MENEKSETDTMSDVHPCVGTCSIHDPKFDANDSRTWTSNNGPPLSSVHDAKEGDA